MADNWEYFDRPASAVETNLATMNDRADEAISTAQGTLDSLSSITLADDGGTPGNFTIPSISIPSAVTPAAPTGTTFGKITGGGDPGYEDVGAAAGVNGDLLFDPGDFSPTVRNPAFPTPLPDIDTSGDPGTAPTVANPTIPGQLLPYTTPRLEPLDVLTITPFPGIDDPPTISSAEIPFTGVPATFTYTTDGGYTGTLQTAILAWINGQDGLPTAVQQALFDAARSRLDQTSLATEQEAFDTFAARGFSMPSGVLAETLSIAQERSRFQLGTLNRDIASKVAELAVENIRAAVAAGIALEGTLAASFDRAAQLTFEAAKGQADIEAKIYDSAVALFNAKQSARQVSAAIYRAQWDGEIARVQGYKAEIDGEVAKGQVNEQRTRAYLAEWEGVKAAADVFNAQIRGQQVVQETNKIAIESFGHNAATYRAIMEARKVPYEAYAETRKGEGQLANAYEAQARGFAETVRAQEAVSNTKIKYIELKVQASRASTEKYQAKLQFERDRVAAELANIQATASAFTADTARYSAEIQGANDARRGEIQIAELRLRSNIAYYETQLKEFDAALERQIKRAQIIVEALKGAGQIGSALASGAMSAIHVSAGMTGSGSVSAANNLNRTQKLADAT